MRESGEAETISLPEAAQPLVLVRGAVVGALAARVAGAPPRTRDGAGKRTSDGGLELPGVEVAQGLLAELKLLHLLLHHILLLEKGWFSHLLPSAAVILDRDTGSWLQVPLLDDRRVVRGVSGQDAGQGCLG